VRIAKAARPGMILALRGGLGAGKTALCRGIARGLNVVEPITSPTYTLINEYDGVMPFYHFDAYRLSSAAEFELLDADRYLYGDGLCAIEWSERVSKALPDSVIMISIEPAIDGSRAISLDGPVLEEALS